MRERRRDWDLNPEESSQQAFDEILVEIKGGEAYQLCGLCL